jgi:very-short-patch-repair endonuclease
MAPPRAVRAVQLGGVLGGGSALASRKIWVDVEPELVVSCRPGASNLVPLKQGERRLWIPQIAGEIAPCEWRASVVDSLVQLAHYASRESLVASVDSALQLNALSRGGLARLLAALPGRLRTIRGQIDGSSMSGTETRMRLALRRRGHRVETQVAIPGIGIVDLLVDGWLIIELDSRGHHSGETNQTRDRWRDGNAVLGQFGHERFMWSQVFYDLEWCVSVVETRLRDGRPVW